MITVKPCAELEEFAREGRRRFEAGDRAWFERSTAHGDVCSFEAGGIGWIVTHGRFRGRHVEREPSRERRGPRP
jgi:hypothetical protein